MEITRGDQFRSCPKENPAAGGQARFGIPGPVAIGDHLNVGAAKAVERLRLLSTGAGTVHPGLLGPHGFNRGPPPVSLSRRYLAVLTGRLSGNSPFGRFAPLCVVHVPAVCGVHVPAVEMELSVLTAPYFDLFLFSEVRRRRALFPLRR